MNYRKIQQLHCLKAKERSVDFLCSNVTWRASSLSNVAFEQTPVIVTAAAVHLPRR